ncbi:hypothetical protein like AT3G09280 [Hibiscus trionum]|uniref:Uncharacterized protein n=1 Tax=Hibiscus trionum TaxID=183268 RepID=A0A9W7J0T6_HIBTR|nr:hypothetical protein like AT3G09280 [Hibiscus trionum]
MGKLVLISLLFLEVLLVHAMADTSEAKPAEVNVHNEDDEPGWVVPREADEPAESPYESSQEHGDGEAEAPEIRRLGKHRSPDESMAGGGVIVGGLAIAVLGVVLAYIRVTRTRDDVEH